MITPSVLDLLLDVHDVQAAFCFFFFSLAAFASVKVVAT